MTRFRTMRTPCAFAGVALALAAAVPHAGAQTPVPGTVAASALVPAPLQRTAQRIRIDLEAVELVGYLADGVAYTYWTFDRQVPGPFLRVLEGDVVELHLSNRPDSRMPHNIDLHAVTGPGGGAAASFVAPGQTATFVFRALTPGLYMYHCATAPVGMHIANGMYGLILVEPAGGLPPADREYYLTLGEFYTDGGFGQQGLRHFDMEKALRETPDYIVFNGAVGALTDDRSLTAHTGERVRLFVGNAGPNLSTAFHVTGAIFDRVWPDGNGPPLQNAQTVSIPPGGAAIAELTAAVPGTYILADHAVFRAFNKGAIANLRVTGDPRPAVYAGRIAEDVYLLEGAAVQRMPVPEDSAEVRENLSSRIARGGRVYARTCQACHQADGRGIPGAFPPLAASDFLIADVGRAVEIVLNGLEGEIYVNGMRYNAVMPALRLSDEEIADVLTYVYSRWGNSGAVVSPALVREVRLCPWCREGGLPPRPR